MQMLCFALAICGSRFKSCFNWTQQISVPISYFIQQFPKLGNLWCRKNFTQSSLLEFQMTKCNFSPLVKFLVGGRAKF